MLPTNKMIIKVPGKLMVAGEFAVLVPHHHLVVTAVNRFVYAAIEDTSTGVLSLQDFDLNELDWDFTDKKINISSDDERISFAKTAMQVACTYLKEQDIEIVPFHLSIHSELDDASGVKYGLGSSAAVVSAIVTAIISRFSKEEPNKNLIFKLAAIAHVMTQGNGSGADIAASVYGGILEYSSFQAEWLKAEYEKTSSISELVAEKWIYLSIEPIQLPENVHFCVGWTGKPASTMKLVDMILKLKETNPTAFKDFLENSEKAVQTFLEGMKKADLPLLYEGVQANRQALREVGKAAEAPIETPLLTRLCDIADKLDGAGKLSGAGGGDCGIAFMGTEESVVRLFKAWEEAGIKPLNLKSHPEGATAIDL